MKAPHPSLRRLFGLAAVPAQRAQAWRSQGAALAALDAVVDDSAAASDARIEALLGEPQVGSVLSGPLARLAAAGQGLEVDAAVPGRLRIAPGPSNPSPAAGRAVSPTMASAAAARQAAGMPPPVGAVVQRRPVPAAAPRAGAATPWPVGARLLPSARSDSPTPVAPAVVVRPLSAPGVAPPGAVEATQGRVIDGPAAAARLKARALKAGAAIAWQQAVDLRPAPASAPPSAAAFDAVPADFGGSARGTYAAVRPPDAAAASPRVEQVLARLAAVASPRVPVSAGSRATAADHTGAAPRQAAAAAVTATHPAAPGSPLQAARIGGFRGLAALGRAAGPTSGPAPAAPSVVMQRAARPQPAALDPQALIDHVESALREQAARSGVSIEGLEP